MTTCHNEVPKFLNGFEKSLYDRSLNFLNVNLLLQDDVIHLPNDDFEFDTIPGPVVVEPKFGGPCYVYISQRSLPGLDICFSMYGSQR